MSIKLQNTTVTITTEQILSIATGYHCCVSTDFGSVRDAIDFMSLKESAENAKEAIVQQLTNHPILLVTGEVLKSGEISEDLLQVAPDLQFIPDDFTANVLACNEYFGETFELYPADDAPSQEEIEENMRLFGEIISKYGAIHMDENFNIVGLTRGEDGQPISNMYDEIVKQNQEDNE